MVTNVSHRAVLPGLPLAYIGGLRCEHRLCAAGLLSLKMLVDERGNKPAMTKDSNSTDSKPSGYTVSSNLSVKRLLLTLSFVSV